MKVSPAQTLTDTDLQQHTAMCTVQANKLCNSVLLFLLQYDDNIILFLQSAY